MVMCKLGVHDIRKRIALARNCTASLDRNISDYSISLLTKLRHYRVLILPAILYGAETRSPTQQLATNPMRLTSGVSLRRISRISWRVCTTNDEVRQLC